MFGLDIMDSVHLILNKNVCYCIAKKDTKSTLFQEQPPRRKINTAVKKERWRINL